MRRFPEPSEKRTPWELNKMPFVIIGIVCLAVGAAIAFAIAKNQNSARVQEANSKVVEAEEHAKRIHVEASRQAETAKKEAILEAKEEILHLKQASENE